MQGYIHKVNQNPNVLLIKDTDGQNDVVIMSKATYDSIQTTMFMLSKAEK